MSQSKQPNTSPKTRETTVPASRPPNQSAATTLGARPSPGPALIVYGLNEERIPQAAWFPDSEAGLATRAALMMGLQVLKVENDDHRQLAAQLRQGQVYASDRTFAPIVQRELFERLSKLAGPAAPPSPVELAARNGEAASRPENWETIQVGSLVIAFESIDDGWWEAVVVAIDNDELVLRWRDFARQPSFRRRRFDVALLPAVAA